MDSEPHGGQAVEVPVRAGHISADRSVPSHRRVLVIFAHGEEPDAIDLLAGRVAEWFGLYLKSEDEIPCSRGVSASDAPEPAVPGAGPLPRW